MFTSQAITKQAPDFTSFYLPTIAKTVTACSNVLESALHGNKSYNSYSQLIARLLLPYCLLGNRSKVSNAAQLRSAHSHEINVSYKEDVTWYPLRQSNGSICSASRQVRKGSNAMTGSSFIATMVSLSYRARGWVRVAHRPSPLCLRI